MAQYAFGSGTLWGTPLTDGVGTAITNPTPVRLGGLQDATVDASFDVKQLYGQNQFPLAVGRGKGKIGIKAKFAQINGSVFNTLFFGQTLNTNGIGNVTDATGTAIPSTPFTITPTPPSSGVWSADLGVRSSLGVPMTRVASAPATGQYSVSAGVYTFAAADTALVVYIDYQYTYTSTSARKSTVTNPLLGTLPTFKTDLSVPYNGKVMIVSFPACTASKLAFATKLDDFIIPELDIEVFADASGNVMTYSMSDN